MYTERYKNRAKSLSMVELLGALRDINDTLTIYANSPETEYTKKLWSEFDAYTLEVQNRRK